ncbi:MAG: DUF4625 domain-containing protein [Prevotella sp.]|nr:DUF4625 domain-containing protein [Prevotella sp.]
MKKTILAFSLLCALCACSSSDDTETKDVTFPVISEQGITANPTDCQVYRRGEPIPFHYVFTDDTELGAYNIEIHNNFDHHTHSTSASECEMEADKDPQHPWVYNQDFTIPAGSKTYTSRFDIPIPADIDPGDYHFMIRLTDRAGWQQLKAMAIKIQE